jgi:hypothetical protein
MSKRYHRGMARQCPCGHDGIKPGEVADDVLAYHLTSHAPNLAMEKAKQLEIKLEVAMAKIQSFGGKGDESVQGGNRQDRADRRERRRQIYRLVPISAVDSSGACRNRAQRR